MLGLLGKFPWIKAWFGWRWEKNVVKKEDKGWFREDKKRIKIEIINETEEITIGARKERISKE